jgi:hypothetical protein
METPDNLASRNLSAALVGYQEKLSMGVESSSDFYHLLKLCEQAIFELRKREAEVLGYQSSAIEKKRGAD